MKKLLYALIFLITPLFAFKPYHMVFNTPFLGAGMFGTLHHVLGMLELYENRRWEGCSINFQTFGLYYDPEYGPNWWEYYFEPIYCGNPGVRYVSNSQKDQRGFYQAGIQLSLKKATALTKKYIKPKPHILEKVKQFQEENFTAAFIIGVHYRGTDKYKEAPRVNFEKVGRAIQNRIDQLQDDNYQIFVATDEVAFLEYAQSQFGDHVIYTPSIRSEKGIPVHFDKSKNRYRAGEEALIDCLLLSSCDFLIRTSSFLSQTALYFNPQLPTILL